MDTLINILSGMDILLAVLLVVASVARMDRRYTLKVRAENTRKAILRGDRHDDF